MSNKKIENKNKRSPKAFKNKNSKEKKKDATKKGLHAIKVCVVTVFNFMKAVIDKMVIPLYTELLPVLSAYILAYFINANSFDKSFLVSFIIAAYIMYLVKDK